MSVSVVWLPEAEAEALEAYYWFEDQQPRLGEAFKAELDEGLKLACEFPLAFPEAAKGIRSIRLRRFHAYAVYYELIGNRLVIYAVFHGSRDPMELFIRLNK